MSIKAEPSASDRNAAALAHLEKLIAASKQRVKDIEDEVSRSYDERFEVVENIKTLESIRKKLVSVNGKHKSK